MVNLHPALSRTGELVFSTNSDADDFWWNFNEPGSADYYRPYFYRVFNWKKVYDHIPDTKIKSIHSPSAHVVNGFPVNKTYSLLGIQTTRPNHGIYIRQGRKVMEK